MGRYGWVLVLLAMTLFVACGAGGGAGAPPAPTSGIGTAATTAHPSPTATTQPQPSITSSLPATTTFAIAPAELPGSTPDLLVAHADGIDLWSLDSTTTVFRGDPVARAVPDLTGGVVFQRETPDGAEKAMVPIEHIRMLGEEPEVLVPGTDEAFALTLVHVALVDGNPALLYREWVEHENTCAPEDAECRWDYHIEWLHLLDLSTLEDRTLAAIGGFEGDSIGVHIGGDRFSVDIEGYGDESACVGYGDLSYLLMGRPGPSLSEPCTMGPTPECPEGFSCTGTVVAAMGDDGATFAYAMAERAQELESTDIVAPVLSPPEIVFVDTATGAEIARHVIGTAGRVHPAFLDFDGRFAVIGRHDAQRGDDWGAPNLPPLLVLAAGPNDPSPVADESPLVWELPVTEQVSIWREALAS